MEADLKIDKIISSFFKAEDYTNDNLPDVLYWYIKRLVLVLTLIRPISESGKETDPLKYTTYHEAFRTSLDATIILARQFFSTNEKYSGGTFLTLLKNESNLISILEKLYVQFITNEQQKTIKTFSKSLPKAYNDIYGYRKKSSYPKSIYEYQKEHFHQDQHEEGEKYKIISYKDLGFARRTVIRRDKPDFDLAGLCNNTETLSGIILEFAKFCEFSKGDILRDCNRFHDDIDTMIRKSASIYNYDFSNEKIAEIKNEIKSRIPVTLKVIPQNGSLL
jgi:hypothetical protein